MTIELPVWLILVAKIVGWIIGGVLSLLGLMFIIMFRDFQVWR